MSSASAIAKLTLYTYWRSSSSYRVRIALELKKLPYEYVAINLLTGQQKSEEYERLNPHKSVPALVVHFHDHEKSPVTITQSSAIIDFLDEIYPDSTPLLPSDLYTRARVREICNIISNDIQPLGNLKVLGHAASLLPSDSTEAARTEAKEKWSRHYIELGFKTLEVFLQSCVGAYCVGDNVTMADLFLVPQVYNAYRWKVDMAYFPTIQNIYDRLIKLEAFEKAHPSKCPDATA
jgi:maleylacetoacetate isomerase